MGSKTEKYKDVKGFWGNPEANKAHDRKVEERIKKGLPSLLVKHCEACARPLGRGTSSGENGRTIWLDLTAKVYCPVFERMDSHTGVVVVRTTLAYLDHNELCPGQQTGESGGNNA